MGAPPQLILCYITAIAHHSEIHTRPGWKTLCAKPISNCNFSPSLLAQEQRGCSTQNTLQGGFPGPLTCCHGMFRNRNRKAHRGAHFATIAVLTLLICHVRFAIGHLTLSAYIRVPPQFAIPRAHLLQGKSRSHNRAKKRYAFVALFSTRPLFPLNS